MEEGASKKRILEEDALEEISNTTAQEGDAQETRVAEGRPRKRRESGENGSEDNTSKKGIDDESGIDEDNSEDDEPVGNRLDQVPGAGRLYIGRIEALYDLKDLDSKKITHILSIVEEGICPTEFTEFANYQRDLINARDEVDQPLRSYFHHTNSFIDAGLQGNGGVLVHCIEGVSRSAAIVCAYLMVKENIQPQQALDRIRQSRPQCRPNDGFWAQLFTYQQELQRNNLGIVESQIGSTS